MVEKYLNWPGTDEHGAEFAAILRRNCQCRPLSYMCQFHAELLSPNPEEVRRLQQFINNLVFFREFYEAKLAMSEGLVLDKQGRWINPPTEQDESSTGGDDVHQS